MTEIDLHAPPADWFSRPDELELGQGVTVTDEGRVFGYLCLWQSRFINGGRRNIRPPRSGNYSYANAFTSKATFPHGEVMDVRVGVLAGVGGHRFANDFESTQQAYADISTKFARVVYGEDENGVWYSGAIMPGVSEDAITAARASAVSGHWEKPSEHGRLELLGAVLVNIPGFAQEGREVHRIAASATATDLGGMIVAPLTDKTVALPQLGERVRFDAAASSIAASGDVQAPINGLLLSLNSETVDGRIIESVTWTGLPLPLFFSDEQTHGHMGSRVVGRIDEIMVEGDTVQFAGVLDGAFMLANGAKDVADLGVLGISIDGAVTGDVVPEFDDNGDDWYPDRIRFTEMQILGATLTSMPAFHETLGVETGDFVETEMQDQEAPAEETMPDTETEEGSDVASAATNIKVPRITGDSDLTIKPPLVWGE